MLQLYLTRSKIFITEVDGAERRFTATRCANGKPIAAPDWVRNTPTYKYGVRDESIMDLTPVRPVTSIVESVSEPKPEPESQKESIVPPADNEKPGDDKDEDEDTSAAAMNEKTARANKGGKAVGLGTKAR